MSRTIIHEKYAKSLPSLTEEDFEKTDAFLHDLDLSELHEWIDKKTATHHLGERAFQMVVDQPNEGDKSKAVVVPFEFANGITPASVVRARIIRDMVDSNASLVMQPNSTFLQANMNYSRIERQRLRRGELDSIMGRIAVTLDSIENPQNLTLVGSSQGSAVVLELANQKDYIPPSAVAVLEAPGVKERSRLELLRDFLSCGTDLNEVVAENYSDSQHPLLVETLRSFSGKERVRYGLGAVSPGNVATLGILLHSRAQSAMRDIVQGGGAVVHAWGTKDAVSPASDNRAIVQEMNEIVGLGDEGVGRYTAYELTGASHSVSNNYSVIGALAREAAALKST